MRIALILLCATLAHAQLFTLSKDELTRLTSKSPFERFDDGRPKAPDALLEKLRAYSAEDVWAILPGKGYPNQFAGDFKTVHPGKKLVGRAVTVQFMPVRADLNEIIVAGGKAKGSQGGQNQWVIDKLQPGDVLVVDMFGQKEGRSIVGDNLAFYIKEITKTGGLIVDGGIRDLEAMQSIEMPLYYRGAHPAAMRNVMLTGFNVPVRIGETTVMPGDVVLGDREGVYFIPPELLEAVLTRAAETKIHDDWTKMKFREGKYKSSDIYGRPRDPALIKEYEEYLKKEQAANSAK